MSWYNPNTWSPDGKAVFVNILIGVVITGLELLRQWQEERGDFDGDDGDLWREGPTLKKGGIPGGYAALLFGRNFLAPIRSMTQSSCD